MGEQVNSRFPRSQTGFSVCSMQYHLSHNSFQISRNNDDAHKLGISGSARRATPIWPRSGRLQLVVALALLEKMCQGGNRRGPHLVPPVHRSYIRKDPESQTIKVKVKEIGRAHPRANRTRTASCSPRAIALVLAGGRGSRLKQLTDRRAKPALGKFRIIDFALSNCINSGFRRIGVITQYKSHSLLRHLQRGWSFLRGEINEFVELLPAQQRIDETSWYQGTADAVYQNIDILDEPRRRACPDPGRRPHLQDGLRGHAGVAHRARAPT